MPVFHTHIQLQVRQWLQGWILCAKYIMSLSTALVGVTVPLCIIYYVEV